MNSSSSLPLPLVNVLGVGCRLPGAPDVSAFSDLLTEGRCAVSEVPQDRWNHARYLHPKPGISGKSYTFAAGIVDSLWDFDAAAFGISPREALQMDPQQRLALQVTWEALEDAGIAAGALAGQRVGVYVGASSTDHGSQVMGDVGAGDPYVMTGNTLSLVSNRISYIFDFQGPSFTVDTACSSSLVALDAAMSALQSGEIDTAVVAGVNVLLSPFPFIGFSAAGMLSPQGRCRPFAQEGNGYVRAEGAVAFLLRRADVDVSTTPALQGRQVHGQLVASAVNSDGHTNGVSLPSDLTQGDLLEALYARAGVDAEQLAFVEAHGTGTKVGDPAEAKALGRALGQCRSKPLPIGSVKSNIGHLEPASGGAGLLKALLALKAGTLPRSLFSENLNEAIDFKGLGLCVAQQAVTLERNGDAPQYAGVSTFGFGGTNAHVIIREAPLVENKDEVAACDVPALVVSAANTEGLQALSGSYADFLRSNNGVSVADFSASVARYRGLLSERLVVEIDDTSAVLQALDDFAAEGVCGKEGALSSCGRSVDGDIAFVFSGNGSQFAGMGRNAYKNDAAFKTHFDDLSDQAESVLGWSARELLFADDLDVRLVSTVIAQPMLFLLQIAVAKRLEETGVSPAVCYGHSVGEVAAAVVSGALNVVQGIDVIFARSGAQEKTRGQGRMAVAAVNAGEAQDIIALLEEQITCLELAADNAGNAVTVSGHASDVVLFIDAVKAMGKPAKMLDLDYAFHCGLMDPIEADLRAELNGLEPDKGQCAFVSTVTGDTLSGETLDAGYWWDNIRKPVQFLQATERALDLGCRMFVEIGPRAIFKGNLLHTITASGEAASFVETLTAKGVRDGQSGADDLKCAVLQMIALGALDHEFVVSGAVKPLALPAYPWQVKPYNLKPTYEAFNESRDGIPYHMLLGFTPMEGDTIWRNHLDPHMVPFLRDHQVNDKMIVPGAGLAEIVLAAARVYFSSERVELQDMDIVRALEVFDDDLIETKVVLSPDSSTVEVFSRRRFGDEEWGLNASARVREIPVEDNVPLFGGSTLPALDGVDLLDADALYHHAILCGLTYGSTFQRVHNVMRLDDTCLHVSLKPPHKDDLPFDAAPFGLHPIDLDAIFHGLVAHYASSNDESTLRHQKGYIPIRFAQLRVYRPHERIAQGIIRITRQTARTLCADFELYDSEGILIATLKEARFRAASLVRVLGFSDLSYHFGSRLIAHGNEPDLLGFNVPEFAHFSELVQSLYQTHASNQSEPKLLLQAAAQRISYDAVLYYAQGKPIEPFVGLASGALNQEGVRRLCTFLGVLEAAGLCTHGDDVWTLAEQVDLPDSDTLLQTVLSDHGGFSAEAILLSHIAQEVARGAVFALENSFSYEAATLDHLYSASSAVLWQNTVLGDIVRDFANNWPEDRALRILEIGARAGGLVRHLEAVVANGRGALDVIAADERAASALKVLYNDAVNVRIVEEPEADLIINEVSSYDLIVAAGSLVCLKDCEGILAASAEKLSPAGRLFVIETEADALHDVMFAFDADWFDRSVDRALPISRQRMADEWCSLLESSGFDSLDLTPLGDSVFLQAKQQVPPKLGDNVIALRGGDGIVQSRGDIRNVIVYGAGEALAVSLANTEPSWHIKSIYGAESMLFDALEQACSEDGFIDLLIYDWQIIDTLLGRVTFLNTVLQRFGDQLSSIWVYADGGAPLALGVHDPVNAGVWTYMRSVKNEFDGLDVRLFDFDVDVHPEERLDLLGTYFSHKADWNEAVLGRYNLRSLLVMRGVEPVSADVDQPIAEASRLDFEDMNGLDDLTWRPDVRRVPLAHEVEVEIAATGLNFRDVMWALGVLPDEALEDGFAGATLGFECSGRIVSVGSDVKGLNVGDPVIALGPACFSSHLTVDAISVSRLPQGVNLVDAATIPVTFLTAYYALYSLAQLEEDEWVLIHGGAGGVGLAALQVAQWCGARIIATAGTQEKRDLLTMLGADHVLDSRSLDFVDDVRKLTDGGVDVVLNSLSGEAMERGIELVKPFGRFLELGKRDYYGNTKIGLRPFRQNISYFGIDADQLLSRKPKLASRLFAELMAHFEDGIFTPLPYRLFEGDEAVSAFRLMQKSGHIGKILIQPTQPKDCAPQRDPHPVVINDNGFVVVVGGLGGFGTTLAKWLYEKGARHLVLLSRSGRTSDEANLVFDDLRAKGCEVRVVSCDGADESALSALFETLRSERPITGYVNAAMVLEDGLISNTTADQVSKVLRPKVDASALADRLLRDDALDLFLLFSSITTLFGNPGQANYVAANGYLEGLARARRLRGDAGLAVGWGAITDVGYLARNEDVGEALARRTGTQIFTAGQALSALGDYMAIDDGRVSMATVALGPMNWGMAKAGLGILNTPTFETLAREAEHSSTGDEDRVDVAGQIEGLSDIDALGVLASLVAVEVSRVLKMPKDDVQTKRPLTDLGMDSLMGVELRVSAQKRLGVDIPLASVANGLTIDDIAQKMLLRFRGQSGDDGGEDSRDVQTFRDVMSAHSAHASLSDEAKAFDSKLRGS